MGSESTIDTVRDIMTDVFDLDELSIDRDTTADDVDEWDSLSHIRLMVAIEREFGIKFKNSEIASLTNVGDLVDMIAAKQS